MLALSKKLNKQQQQKQNKTKDYRLLQVFSEYL